MRTRVVLATLLGAALASASPASAAVIFRQTFDGGLGANESLGGKFAVGNGHVGHLNNYANNEYSYYQVALDLTGATKAFLSFDFDIMSEIEYDGFNLLGSLGSTFNAATDLLTPTAGGAYGPMKGGFVRLGNRGVSGEKRGTLEFDLSQFAGQTVNLRFQFQSDQFAFKRGVWFDNVTVTDGVIASPVPEPATWAMMIAGFGLAGASVRSARRRSAACA